MTTMIPFADIVGNEPACRLIGPDGAGTIEWVGSPYTVINAAHTTGLDGANWALTAATRENPPTCAIGPATGVVGVKTLEVLHRAPALHLADSDSDSYEFALTLGGEFVGFSARGTSEGAIPAEDLPAWRDLACFAEAHPHIVCTDDAALWAAGVIIALNQTGILL